MTTKTHFHYTEIEARDFFARLAAYSAEYVKNAVKTSHKRWPSQNFYKSWANGGPVGHVLHYTAAPSFAGTIRHFVEGSTASSHWVVAKSLDRKFDQLREDMQLSKDMRAELVQIVPPSKPAWHAGWVNKTCLGTEIRNVGVLRAVPKGAPFDRMDDLKTEEFFKHGDEKPEDLNFYWYLDGWSTPFTGEVVNIKTPSGSTWHESWSRGQLATTVVLLRYANALNKGRGGLDPDWFLSHHQVNPSKWDIARGLDMKSLRDAVLYSTKHVDDLPYLTGFDDVESKFEAMLDEHVLHQMNMAASDRADDLYDGFDPLDARGRVDVPEVPAALKVLGFPCTDAESIAKCTRIYQRGRGLTVDGIAGRETRSSLERDLRRYRLQVDTPTQTGVEE